MDAVEQGWVYNLVDGAATAEPFYVRAGSRVKQDGEEQNHAQVWQKFPAKERSRTSRHGVHANWALVEESLDGPNTGDEMRGKIWCGTLQCNAASCRFAQVCQSCAGWSCVHDAGLRKWWEAWAHHHFVPQVSSYCMKS